MSWKIVILIAYFCSIGWLNNGQFLSKYDDFIFFGGLVILLSFSHVISRSDLTKLSLIGLSVIGLYFVFSGNPYLDQKVYTMISTLNSERINLFNDNTAKSFYRKIQNEIDQSFTNNQNISFSMTIEIDRMLSKTEMMASRIINYAMHQNSNSMLYSSINFGNNFYQNFKLSFIVILLPFSFSLIILKLKLIKPTFWTLTASTGLLVLLGLYYRFLYLQGNSVEGSEILGLWQAPEPRISFASFTYKNHWSAYVILVLSICLCLFFQILKTKVFAFFRCKKSVLLLVFTIISVLSVFYSSSNSGLIFVFLFLLSSIVLLSLKKISLKFIAPFVFISIFLASLSLTQSMIIDRVKDLLSGDSFRLNLWSDIVNQIQIKTFWGYGLDSYKTINGIFQSTEITSARVQNLQGAHQQYIPITIHAHTDFLQILSEIGFIGSSLIIFPIIFGVVSLIFTNPSTKSNFTAIALNIILLYSIVDFPFRNIAVSSMFVFLLSINALSHKHKRSLYL
ncbi:MAG: O-antigen ligase family protein [Verrucomicrobiota bacterium]|nr:O-antigen ligase family protein [Verrucomicrobiota bacterium]